MHYGSSLFSLGASFLMILHFLATLILKRSLFFWLPHSLPGASALRNVAGIGLFFPPERDCLLDKRYKADRSRRVGTKHTQKEPFTQVHLGLSAQTVHAGKQGGINLREESANLWFRMGLFICHVRIDENV